MAIIYAVDIINIGMGQELPDAVRVSMHEARGQIANLCYYSHPTQLLLVIPISADVLEKRAL
jgi:hypothetical protein